MTHEQKTFENPFRRISRGRGFTCRGQMVKIGHLEVAEKSSRLADGGGMAEWLASPDWDREVVGSNPGVARSDGK